MPLPPSSRSITTLNVINATNNTQNWSYLPVTTAVKDSTNPAFARQWVLTAQGLTLTRSGSSVGVMLEPLAIPMVQANPSLTWPPTISPNPSNVTIGWGNATNFAIAATDEITNFGLSTDITYQWQFSTTQGTSWSNLSVSGPYTNVTTNHLNISNSAWLSNGTTAYEYRCLAINPSGTSNSNAAILVTDPTVTVNPPASANINVSVSIVTNFGVSATGNSALTYQWQANTGGGFANITTAGTPNYSNFTTNTLTISNVATAMNAYNFRCLVLDTGGTANSNALQLLAHT